jgi:hypothetical protein
MKRFCLTVLVALSFNLPVHAEENENPLSADAAVAFLSAYVSRGQVSNDRMVMQPEITVAKGGFSFYAWGNFNLTDRVTEKEDFSEIDLALAYDFPVEAVELQVGFYEYVYPHTIEEVETETEDGSTTQVRPYPGTREIYLSAGYPNDYVTPSLTIYYDIDEADGAYFYGALEREVAITEKLSLTPGFSSGYGTRNYNDFFFGVDENAWNDGNVYLNADYSLTEAISVGATLQYMWLWDSEIEEGAEEFYLDKESLFGGVALGYEF